jgi:hypothetical protein
MDPKSDKQVIFSFNKEDQGSDKDDREELESEDKEITEEPKKKVEIDIQKKPSNQLQLKAQKPDVDNRSEGKNNLNHIKNIDVYDRLNFKRIQVKRNSRKVKTEKCPKMNFTIEKFSDEITKITEELSILNSKSANIVGETLGRSDTKKRTIRFNNKKVTYQYPKEKENVFNLLTTNTNETSLSSDIYDVEEKETIYTFNFNEEETEPSDKEKSIKS